MDNLVGACQQMNRYRCGECIYTHTRVYTHTMQYYLATRKMKFTFATAEMNLEGIMLTEISQIQRQKPYDFYSHININNKIAQKSNIKKTNILNIKLTK